MAREPNIHLIQTLEKQIEEGDGDIIKLKRTRNSLLLSVQVPPEILGKIFIWRLFRNADGPQYWRGFYGLEKGSYNFLLVCHRWFEVAYDTPELWSFWGNTLQDWNKRYCRSAAAPLDLVLNDSMFDYRVPFDGPLQDAVRSRVVQGTIRQAHLLSNDYDTLAPIISSLVPGNEGYRNENIESIIWRGGGGCFMDVSDFFAQSHLSNLRFLELSGSILNSSWDGLASWTTHLTILSFEVSGYPTSPTITSSQLLSILVSNPNLRELTLSNAALPNDVERPASRIPLSNLKLLFLKGDFRNIFGLLDQLVLPETLDDLHLNGFNSTIEDISQTLVPYMRDHFRRDARFQGELELSYISAPYTAWIVVRVIGPQTTEPAQKLPLVELKMIVPYLLPLDVQEQLFIDMVALTPQEHVVSFDTNFDIKSPERLFPAMPNIKMLNLNDVELTEGFLQPNPDGPHANTKLFPSLRSLYLEGVRLVDGDWGHLKTYLAHQTSNGQVVSLEVLDSPDMPPDVVDEVEGLVEKFTC